MRRTWFRFGVLLAAVAGLGSSARSAWACAACFGQSDSPLAAGMNWGIASLLVVVVGVLGAIATFFIYLGRRSARLAELSEAGASELAGHLSFARLPGGPRFSRAGAEPHSGNQVYPPPLPVHAPDCRPRTGRLS